MTAERVTFVYTAGPKEGRRVETGPEKVRGLLDGGAELEVLDGAEHLTGPEPEPAPVTAPASDASDGWPPGYTYERSGAYYAVSSPGGEPVASDSPSGKWNGEDAAQEAAWTHYAEGAD